MGHRKGRPPKPDRAADAERALEQQLQGPGPDVVELTEEQRARVRAALGETEYAVDTLTVSRRDCPREEDHTWETIDGGRARICVWCHARVKRKDEG